MSSLILFLSPPPFILFGGGAFLRRVVRFLHSVAGSKTLCWTVTGIEPRLPERNTGSMTNPISNKQSYAAFAGVWAVRLLATWLAWSTVSHAGSQTMTRPVEDDDGPTKIYVAMVLLDVDEVDTAGQNFTANLFAEVRWQDSRLSHPGPGQRVLPIDAVWYPQLLFVNQQKVWATLSPVVRVSPSGEVLYRQRVWGPFSQPLDVREFPFDVQEFEMRVACAGASMEEVLFLPDPQTPSGLAKRFSLPDWQVLDWKLNFDPYRPMGSGQGAASVASVFRAKRHASHYVLKVILPLILIVAMSSIVFWIDPSQAGSQVGVATTSMLTLIAYRFMVGGSVPAVPYLTRLDYFILGSTLLVFAALIQAVVTSTLAARNRAVGARRIDVWCRILFPLSFAAVAVWSLIM